MGRLIDADELKKDYPHDSDWEYPVNTNEYVCESIDNAPTVEAIPKADYENRLKADMVAMLTELQLEIEEKFNDRPFSYNHHQRTEFYRDIDEIIQQKIDRLAESEEKE